MNSEKGARALELFIRSVVARCLESGGLPLQVDENYWDKLTEANKKYYKKLYKEIVKSVIEESK